VLLIGLLVAGCGEDASSSSAVAAPASTQAMPDTTAQSPVEPTGVSVTVTALDNTFRPDRIEVNVGDEVIWENGGRNEHNVLRVGGVDLAGNGWGVEVDEFQPGDVYAHVFTEPGEFRYYCSIHGNQDVGMVGTIIVTG
jgi:plastocyanin